ncbi:MAG: hypothetical protein AB7S26_25690 [Sandaracinaceae bacterium]
MRKLILFGSLVLASCAPQTVGDVPIADVCYGVLTSYPHPGDGTFLKLYYFDAGGDPLLATGQIDPDEVVDGAELAVSLSPIVPPLLHNARTMFISDDPASLTVETTSIANLPDVRVDAPAVPPLGYPLVTGEIVGVLEADTLRRQADGATTGVVIETPLELPFVARHCPELDYSGG